MASLRKNENIRDFYKIDKLLGKGSFAIVKKGINKKTGQEVAIKIIERDKLEEDDELALQNEVDILGQIDHPNVVKLFEVYDEPKRLYMVLEIMTGGELFDRIVDKEHYSEKEASDTIRPIVDAIRYCHTLGIVHRDLKPENLLYETNENSSVIKVTDFGLAKFMSADLATTACGTPGYVAPEILKGKGYGKAVDFWSIGVILYVLLCGFPPFYEETNKKLFEKIKSGKYDFPSPYWDDISDMAKDLIRKLLVVDPSKRLTADEILEHPWVVGEMTPRKMLPNVTDKIRQFNLRRKSRLAALTQITEGKFQNSLKRKSDIAEEAKKPEDQEHMANALY